jgi:hypothetical protein
MRFTLLFWIGCLVYFLTFVALANAQTPETYLARYYNAGASAPVQTEAFAASGAACNLLPSPGGSTVNPTLLEWNDIANVGRVCRRVSAGAGNLQSLPIGSYEATLSASNTGGTSPESNRAPFSRAVVAPGAPTGFRVAP